MVRSIHTTVPGPYVPKSDGGIYFRFPHGDDQLIALCKEGADPDRIASMMNFALAKGFEVIAGQAKAGNGRVQATRKVTHKTNRGKGGRLDEATTKASDKPCSYCGGKQVLTGKHGKDYCGECSRSYSNGYTVGLMKAAGVSKNKELDAAISSVTPPTVARWRHRAQKAGAEAREANIKERGLKILRKHPSLIAK